MTLAVLVFWIYLFVLTLVFILQWLTLHWEILILFLSQSPLTFRQTPNGMPNFNVKRMTILLLIGTVFVIISEAFHGRISLNSVLLLLSVHFLSEFRLEFMYIFLTVKTMSRRTYLHGFYVIVLLP